MKRKHAQQKAVSALADNGASSQTSTGAMDSLLEKLRAAAPQARDQRDRRRRARLKDRHQVRVASGQKIPDLNEIPEVEAGLHKEETISEEGNPLSPGLTSPHDGEDDVADRAAALLQGMRGGEGADGDDPDKRESLRKARRQTAEEERRLRRRRREKAAASQGDDSTLGGDDTPMQGTDGAPAEEDNTKASEEMEGVESKDANEGDAEERPEEKDERASITTDSNA